MSLSASVQAAIIGGVISGIISLAINIVSLGVQYWINRRNERRVKKEQWRRETISVLKELRREALRIDLSGQTEEQIGAINEIINEVERRKDKVPPSYLDSSIISDLDDIIMHHRRAKADSTTALSRHRQTLINDAETALDTMKEVSNVEGNLY